MPEVRACAPEHTQKLRSGVWKAVHRRQREPLSSSLARTRAHALALALALVGSLPVVSQPPPRARARWSGRYQRRTLSWLFSVRPSRLTGALLLCGFMSCSRCSALSCPRPTHTIAHSPTHPPNHSPTRAPTRLFARAHTRPVLCLCLCLLNAGASSKALDSAAQQRERARHSSSFPSCLLLLLRFLFLKRS